MAQTIPTLENEIAALESELGRGILLYEENTDLEVVPFEKLQERLGNGSFMVVTEFKDYPLEEPCQYGSWMILPVDIGDNYPNYWFLQNNYLHLGSYVGFVIVVNEDGISVREGDKPIVNLRMNYRDRTQVVFEKTKRISELLGVRVFDPDRPRIQHPK